MTRHRSACRGPDSVSAIRVSLPPPPGAPVARAQRDRLKHELDLVAHYLKQVDMPDEVDQGANPPTFLPNFDGYVIDVLRKEWDDQGVPEPLYDLGSSFLTTVVCPRAAWEVYASWRLGRDYEDDFQAYASITDSHWYRALAWCDHSWCRGMGGVIGLLIDTYAWCSSTSENLADDVVAGLYGRRAEHFGAMADIFRDLTRLEVPEGAPVSKPIPYLPSGNGLYWYKSLMRGWDEWIGSALTMLAEKAEPKRGRPRKASS